MSWITQTPVDTVFGSIVKHPDINKGNPFLYLYLFPTPLFIDIGNNYWDFIPIPIERKDIPEEWEVLDLSNILNLNQKEQNRIHCTSAIQLLKQLIKDI